MLMWKRLDKLNFQKTQLTQKCVLLSDAAGPSPSEGQCSENRNSSGLWVGAIACKGYVDCSRITECLLITGTISKILSQGIMVLFSACQSCFFTLYICNFGLACVTTRLVVERGNKIPTQNRKARKTIYRHWGLKTESDALVHYNKEGELHRSLQWPENKHALALWIL